MNMQRVMSLSNDVFLLDMDKVEAVTPIDGPKGEHALCVHFGYFQIPVCPTYTLDEWFDAVQRGMTLPLHQPIAAQEEEPKDESRIVAPYSSGT